MSNWMLAQQARIYPTLMKVRGVETEKTLVRKINTKAFQNTVRLRIYLGLLKLIRLNKTEENHSDQRLCGQTDKQCEPACLKGL